MSKGCIMGKLRGSVGSATWFDGMNLADYGYPGGGPVHMRLNNDPLGATYDGLCSYTNNANNNQWNDGAIDGHWGNGLEIWMR